MNVGYTHPSDKFAIDLIMNENIMKHLRGLTESLYVCTGYCVMMLIRD